MNPDGEVIVEGFLCPICLRDLSSFHNLQNHFETAHSREDKAVFGQMKDFFSKTKNRFLGTENEGASVSSRTERSVSDNPEFHDPLFWEPQELGETRSHMDKFKRHRNARIDGLVIATNKILIRLEKLIKILLESDNASRKSYEQMVVHWAPDDDVPFCPTCGDKFNVARRRHHCRLCGAIMCTKCSVFLSYEFAENVVKSLQSSASAIAKKSPQKSVAVNPDNYDLNLLTLRSCVECRNVLYNRKEKVQSSMEKSLLKMLYKKMHKALCNAETAIPQYAVMANSLNNGETEYRLETATQVRFELTQMFEAVDVLSKKIEHLNTNDDENPPSNIEIRLQRNIRRMALCFLQEYMLTLPVIPSEPKLKILQAKRKAELEKKLRLQRQEQERQRAEEKRLLKLKQLKEEEKQNVVSSKPESIQSEDNITRPNNLAVISNGWSADTVSIFSNSSKQSLSGSSDDESEKEDEFNPILEQINYVREAAKQAREAGMMEEAESLELNLSELQKEYRKQQTAKAFMSTPSTEHAVTTFTPSVRNSVDTGEDPLVQQMKYISQCIRDAEDKQKWDEADMLKRNLNDLKIIIAQSK